MPGTWCRLWDLGEHEMSEHESEMSQSGPEANWEAASPFSTNGNDGGEPAVAIEAAAPAEPDDQAKFLADLANAMRSTAAAEQARIVEGTEQRSQAHIDAIRAREALEAEEFRELAKEDVQGIDAWSEEEIKRIKLERERRIAARREQLQIRLEEHRSVVAREVEAVEAAIVSYRTRIDEFFRGIDAETDPVTIARLAGNRPTFPDLAAIGPDDAPVMPTYGYEAIATQTSEPSASDEGGRPRDGGPSGGEPAMVGVMDPGADGRSAETPWDAGVEAGSESGPPGSDEGRGQGAPAPTGAEASVVMPRASGVGSWLRWPTSSANHSDARR
jgi:hypothetical protein